MAPYVSTERLSAFLETVRPFFTPANMEERLRPFLGALCSILTGTLVHVDTIIPGERIEPNALEQWLDSLRNPLEAAKRGGYLCDPWEIASLRRDEVRNSAVLAWLLSPRGSHGFGSAFLESVLRKVVQTLSTDFPSRVSPSVAVRTETCPDGDIENRVDIEIDDLTLYLIIEVKIGALEGDRQIERYAEIAKAKARNRPWAVVYLNSSGKAPLSAGTWMDRVVPISWKTVAFLLSSVLRDFQRETGKNADAHQRVTALLADSFVRHIRKF